MMTKLLIILLGGHIGALLFHLPRTK